MPTLYIKAPLACLEPGAAGGIVVKDGRIAELVAAGGSPATSSRRISTSGCAPRARVTSAAKPFRSTARAEPAGTWLASAARMTMEQHHAELLLKRPDLP